MKSAKTHQIWGGAISFGLINIPVSVESADQDHDLHFNQLDKRDLAHIRYKRVNEKTGKEVPYSQIVKAYHHSSGKYVVMAESDFKQANPKATQTIDIQSFVEMEEIDPTYFERPYFLIPKKNGEKGYHLLLEALMQAKKAAVATVVMHTKEHLCCIFPRGNFLYLEMLRFAHTLKPKPSFYPSGVKFKSQELAMAETLIKNMTEKWKPEQYKDTYYSDLKKHIEKKLKAGKGKLIEDDSEKEIEKIESADSEDLMTLLKASLKKKQSRQTSSHSRFH